MSKGHDCDRAKELVWQERVERDGRRVSVSAWRCRECGKVWHQHLALPAE